MQDTKQSFNQMKYLFICGCSMSGVGKGTTISSLGKLLINQNYIVTAIKIDPYLNIDAGTMSPSEHGEVFVLDDGGEVDLDLGNYERALNAKFTKHHNITSGKVFKSVLDDERKGLYLGKTIQMIPHVTDRIKLMIESTAENYRDSKGNKAHICLVEIGGTVGDLESGIFFEAMRQFIYDKDPANCAIILLAYVPMIGSIKEAKTKLTQHGIKELKSLGLFPNFIICRSSDKLDESVIKKISSVANLPTENVGSCYDVSNMCDIPLILNEQEFDKKLLSYFKFGCPGNNVSQYKILSDCYTKNKQSKVLSIAICGKYCNNNDTYFSVIKSIEDSCTIVGRKLQLDIIDVTDLEIESEENDKKIKHVKTFDGIIVPGGFGTRGTEGMILVCKIARENKIPFLGICLGMQIAVIEFCRNVLGIKNATSSEFEPESKYDVISTMEDVNYKDLGGTLRLGLKLAIIKNKDSLAYKIYGWNKIYERHRHRWEVNNKYVEEIEKMGLLFSGANEEGDRMDMMELEPSMHPFYFAVQSHPEFLTKSFYPSLPFYAFMLHAAGKKEDFDYYSSQKMLYTGSKGEFDRSYFMSELTKIANK